MSCCTRSASQGTSTASSSPTASWGRMASTFRTSVTSSAGIDREVLQIMYMHQRSDLYNDWGEWSDTSHHLMGQSEDGALNFGVALFNGLPQPWVRGIAPDTFLVDNSSLSGTATWNGALLGFSGPSPIAGDAALEVQLSTLTDARPMSRIFGSAISIS